MNKKKLLALLMALVMALTLVPVTAFADNITYPEADITQVSTYHPVNVYNLAPLISQEGDITNVDVHGTASPSVVYTYSAPEDNTLMLNEGIGSYNCDFVVSIVDDTKSNDDVAVKAYSFGLFGDYSGLLSSNNFVDIGFLSPVDVYYNQEIPLLDTVAKIPWKYYNIAKEVNTFICGAFNTAQENLGKTFRVKLVLWEPAYNTYEEAVENEAVHVVSSIDYVIDTVTPLYVNNAPYIYRFSGRVENGFMFATDSSFGSGTIHWLTEDEFKAYEGPHYAPVVATVTVDGKESGFTSLAEAVTFANASTGSETTITLLSNCSTGDATIADPLALTKANAVLDLNGKTVTVNNNFSFVMQGDRIEVKGGNIFSSSNTAKNTDYHSYVLVINDCDGVKLTGLTTKGGISVGGSKSDWGTAAKAATNVVIENCNITSGDYYAIASQITGSLVTIKSGTYTSNQTAVRQVSGGQLSPCVLYAAFKNNDGPEGSIVVEGGFFNGTISTTGNSGFITLKGGYYTSNPNDNLVADGYEKVALTTPKVEGNVTYNYQVGKVKAADLQKQEETATTTAATYTAEKKVVDAANEEQVLSAGATITVYVTANQVDVVDRFVETKAPAVLSNLTEQAMNDIVQAAVENAPEATTTETPHVDVEILVVKSAAATTKDPIDTEKVTQVTYEVHPEAIIKVNNEQVDKVRLDNDQLQNTFSFQLDVSDIATEGQVNLSHKHDENNTEYLGVHTVTDGKITVKGITSFSTFIVDPVVVNNEENSLTVGAVGASLRRRVRIDNPDTVVNTSTDFRVTFQWNVTGSVQVKPTESKLLWSTDGEHWVEVLIQNCDETNRRVSLVITGIPRTAFGTTISTKLHLVYDETSVDVTGPAYSVNGIADALAGGFSEGNQWGDYARYLRGDQGYNSYSLASYQNSNS